MSQASYSTDSDDFDDELYDVNELFDFKTEGLTDDEFDKDIELFRVFYPNESINISKVESLKEANVTFSVSPYILEDCVLDAWGLIKELPIIIDMLHDYPNYSPQRVPRKFSVYQAAKVTNSSILNQLKSIVEAFFQRLSKEKNSGSDEASFNSKGTKDLSSDTFAKDVKSVPCSSNGPFVQLYQYIQQRMLSLNEFCPICDERHTLSFTSMLKPVVCARPLCIFSSQTLGVMANFTESLHLQPKVIQLLISMTMAAVSSERHEIALQPSGRHEIALQPSGRHETALQPFIEISSLVPDYDKMTYSEAEKRKIILKALKFIPSIENMLKLSESNLIEDLNSKHVLCYPLLRWIISSNRSHIIPLPKEKQLPFMITDCQFLLRNRPPMEDEQFKKLVKRYGSTFAFHGSPGDNWHSILRQGLMVGSGTERQVFFVNKDQMFQLNGCAYGSGIYLSPSLLTAIRYSLPTYIQRDPGVVISDYRQKTYVTLCEVIKTKLKLATKDIWVCPKERYVCTRFIFWYETRKGVLYPQNVNVTEMSKIGLIRAALT